MSRNDKLFETLRSMDQKFLSGFDYFNYPPGLQVLETLKSIHAFYDPCISGTTRDSEAHFNDGVKTVIRDIEFIANFLKNKHLLEEEDNHDRPDNHSGPADGLNYYDYSTE